jgi:hypothetical protein
MIVWENESTEIIKEQMTNTEANIGLVFMGSILSFVFIRKGLTVKWSKGIVTGNMV